MAEERKEDLGDVSQHLDQQLLSERFGHGFDDGQRQFERDIREGTTGLDSVAVADAAVVSTDALSAIAAEHPEYSEAEVHDLVTVYKYGYMAGYRRGQEEHELNTRPAALESDDDEYSDAEPWEEEVKAINSKYPRRKLPHEEAVPPPRSPHEEAVPPPRSPRRRNPDLVGFNAFGEVNEDDDTANPNHEVHLVRSRLLERLQAGRTDGQRQSEHDAREGITGAMNTAAAAAVAAIAAAGPDEALSERENRDLLEVYNIGFREAYRRYEYEREYYPDDYFTPNYNPINPDEYEYPAPLESPEWQHAIEAIFDRYSDANYATRHSRPGGKKTRRKKNKKNTRKRKTTRKMLRLNRKFTKKK